MTEHGYPWSRELWGLLLDRLFEAGARLVMFDIVFDTPKEGDEIFRAALDRYRDTVVIGANFDLSKMRQLGELIVNVPPADSLISPPQMQDDRVGCVIIFPDPLDNRIRSVCYRFTDQQLLGNDPLPEEKPYEALSTRALRKLGHANDIPPDLQGHLLRFGEANAYPPRPLWEVFYPKTWQAVYQKPCCCRRDRCRRFRIGFDRRTGGLDTGRFFAQTPSLFFHTAFDRGRVSWSFADSLRSRWVVADGSAAAGCLSREWNIRPRL